MKTRKKMTEILSGLSYLVGVGSLLEETTKRKGRRSIQSIGKNLLSSSLVRVIMCTRTWHGLVLVKRERMSSLRRTGRTEDS